MISKIKARVTKNGIAFVVVAGFVAGMITSTVAAHAQPIDNGEAGTATCLWAGKTYNEGDKVKQDDGNEYRCSSDGTWVLAFVAPPVRLHNSFRGGVFYQAR